MTTLLRAEVWSRGDGAKLHRVTVQQIPSQLSEVPVVVAYGRLVILGGDQQRLNEEVITAGGVIREGRFRRLNVLEVNYPAASSGASYPKNCFLPRRVASLTFWR